MSGCGQGHELVMDMLKKLWLKFATQRVCVFISESDGCIAIRCVALIDWKAAEGSADDVLFLVNG